MRNIFFALAKRRNPQADAAQTVIQILTEISRAYVGLYIMGAPADNPRGTARRAVSANLEGWVQGQLEQEPLTFRIQIADFVEIEGRAILRPRHERLGGDF